MLKELNERQPSEWTTKPMSHMTLSACALVYAADRTQLWPEVTKDTFKTVQPASEQDDVTWAQSLLAICMACNEKADL